MFDYVVISIHSNFKMSESEMTKRIIRALKSKHVTSLGHPGCCFPGMRIRWIWCR